MNTGAAVSTSFLVAMLLLGIVALGMWGCPQYAVYEQGLTGHAALARAEQDRQIKVVEAQAKLEAAKSLADAEIERARGVAAANKIIADGLGGPDGYLRYLFINGLFEQPGKVPQIIYIPTEANLPLLEAGRR